MVSRQTCGKLLNDGRENCRDAGAQHGQQFLIGHRKAEQVGLCRMIFAVAVIAVVGDGEADLVQPGGPAQAAGGDGRSSRQEPAT